VPTRRHAAAARRETLGGGAAEDAARPRAEARERARPLRAERLAALGAWLERRARRRDIPGCFGHWTLDAIDTKTRPVENRADAKKPGKTGPRERVGAGHAGQALRFTGDDARLVPGVLGALPPWQPFHVLVSGFATAGLERDAVVFLARRAPTRLPRHRDRRSRGGRLRCRSALLARQRFGRGFRTRARLLAGRFVHVAACTMGRRLAAGPASWLDRRPRPRPMVSWPATGSEKSPANNGGGRPTSRAAFRSFWRLLAGRPARRSSCATGRELAPFEVRQLCDGPRSRRRSPSRDGGGPARLLALAVDTVLQAGGGKGAGPRPCRPYYAAATPVTSRWSWRRSCPSRGDLRARAPALRRRETGAARVARDTPEALPRFPAGETRAPRRGSRAGSSDEG
jgi:hypothetical protein